MKDGTQSSVEFHDEISPATRKWCEISEKTKSLKFQAVLSADLYLFGFPVAEQANPLLAIITLTQISDVVVAKSEGNFDGWIPKQNKTPWRNEYPWLDKSYVTSERWRKAF